MPLMPDTKAHETLRYRYTFIVRLPLLPFSSISVDVLFCGIKLGDSMMCRWEGREDYVRGRMVVIVG